MSTIRITALLSEKSSQPDPHEQPCHCPHLKFPGCWDGGRILSSFVSFSVLLSSDRAIRERLTVHCSGSELSCGDPVVEQSIDLAKVPTLGLRKPKPAPYVAKKICAGIEESYMNQHFFFRPRDEVEGQSTCVVQCRGIREREETYQLWHPNSRLCSI